MIPLQPGKRIGNIILACFLLCLAVHVFLMFVGFHNTISDSYEFRQTQTALTVYYFLKDGLSLAYKTPLLGYPWMMPFELPVYQWCVAGLCMVSGWPVETCGRLISIVFFYLCLLPTAAILKMIQLNRQQVYVVLMFILVNPVLLFWSRTFMIESTVLFFSLMFLYFFIAIIKNYEHQRSINFLYVLGATIAGSLSAMIKITTFLTFLMVAGLFVINALYGPTLPKKKHRSSLLLITTSILLLSLLSGIGWTRYADHLKSLSYLGNLTASYNINHLNFGAFSRRFSPTVWKVLIARSSYALPITIVIIVLSIIFPLRYKKQILLFAIPAVMTPLIITQLYFDHDYYTYANTIFFSISAALFALSVWELSGTKYVIVLRAFAGFTALTAVFIYFHRYLPIQSFNDTDMYKIGKKIKAATQPDDVLLERGFDWSSAIPYYAERKVVCLAPDWEVSEDYNKRKKDVPAFLQLFQSSHITAFVVWVDSGSINEFDRKVAAFYGLAPEPLVLKEREKTCFLFTRH